jgi:hypothetical protein
VHNFYPWGAFNGPFFLILKDFKISKTLYIILIFKAGLAPSIKILWRPDMAEQKAKITPIIIKVNGVEMNEQEFKEFKKKNKKKKIKKIKTSPFGSVNYEGKVLHLTEFAKPSEDLFLFGKEYTSSFEFSAGAKDNKGKNYKIFWVFIPGEKNIFKIKQTEENYEQESHKK